MKMIKKGFVIGILIVFLIGSLASGITINLTDSVKQSEQKNPQSMGDRDSGLVAHWDFDEGTGDVLHDVSGNGNDGEIYGAGWITGIHGTALEFDGVDDYVDIGDPSSVLDFGEGDFSESYWIYPYSKDGDYIGHISLWNPQPPLRLSTVFHSGNLQIYTNDANWHDTGKTIQINQWSHIVWVKNGNMLNLYINGTETGWSMTHTNSVGPFNEMLISNHPGPGYFDGIFDEISFYNRALTSEEIQYLYDNPGVGDTVYVDDDYNESTPGWQIDHFDKIKDGVNAVALDGTVYVYNGTYYENVDITKDGINLIGEDKLNTIVDGYQNGYSILIRNQQHVNVSGFTVRNGTKGILIRAESGNSRYNTISDCILYNNIWDGGMIHADSHASAYAEYNVIKDCIAFDNGHTGIGIHITSNGAVCRYNEIYNCNVYNNSHVGIRVDANGNGILSDNVIYHNNVLNNINNSFGQQSNEWDEGYPSGGNYWDDYNGTDSDGDGIGDTPYSIPGGDNKDNYPLMYHFGPPYADFTYDNETSVFDASSSGDYDGEIVNWTWYFGDGTNGYGKVIHHKYCEIGTYHVTLRVTDDDGFKDRIIKRVEVVIANIPPSLEINGPSHGKPLVIYEYIFTVTDPDGDEFYLWVDWGDGDSTGWIGPYIPDIEIKLNNAWNETGTYIIKAKIRDFCGESNWVEFSVTIPRDKSFNRPLFQFLQNHPYLFPYLQKLVQQLSLGL
jgi:hypothetical protein